MNKLTLTLLGNALIEYDPRDYFANPLSDILPLLAEQDVVFTNFEGAVCAASQPCERTRFDSYFHGTTPNVLDYLHHLGVNALSLANNHAWDWGNAGVLDTLTEANGRFPLTAGLGQTLADASRANITRFGNTLVGLLGCLTLDDHDKLNATPAQAGVYRLGINQPAELEQLQQRVIEGAKTADFLIVHHHFHHQPGENNAAWQQQVAHAVIDAGASLYVAHGEPVLKGIELYKKRPIFYGLGSFIFHIRAPLGQYPAEVWESALVQLVIQNGSLTQLVLHPLALDEGEAGPHFLQKRGFPSLAPANQAQTILNRLDNLSRPFGTPFFIQDKMAVIPLGNP